MRCYFPVIKIPRFTKNCSLSCCLIIFQIELVDACLSWKILGLHSFQTSQSTNPKDMDQDLLIIEFLKRNKC